MAFIDLTVGAGGFLQSRFKKLLECVLTLVAKKRFQGILRRAEVMVEDAQSLGQVAALEGGVGGLGEGRIAVDTNEGLHASVDVVVAEVKDSESHVLAFKRDVRANSGPPQRQASTA